MPPTKRKKTTMSDAHKAALAEGRAQGRAVRNYLEALEAHKPKRGRKRTPDSMKKRLATIDAEFADGDQLKRLQLAQERLDLKRELTASTEAVDLTRCRREFVAAAKPYGERKGITYAAWREVGVPDSVLKAAGHHPRQLTLPSPAAAEPGARSLRPGTPLEPRRGAATRAEGGRRCCRAARSTPARGAA